MTNDSRAKPLWTCPRCGNAFTQKNASHSCGVWSLDDHFRDRPKARELFGLLRATVEQTGPVRVVVQKTRLCFMTRVRFAACSVRKDYLRAHLWLARRFDAPRFTRIETLSPTCHIHHFVLREPKDFDRELRALIRESRKVGEE